MAISQIINPTTGGTVAGGGGGGSDMKTDNLTSQVDGSNVTFATSENYVQDSLQVYYNGILQIIGEGIYYISSNQFGFSVAPSGADKVVAIYSIQL